MHSSVRPLARASLQFALQFPIVKMRRKLRVNIREMFFAHRKVRDATGIKLLVNAGWKNLETMLKLQSLHSSNADFFTLLLRKSAP